MAPRKALPPAEAAVAPWALASELACGAPPDAAALGEVLVLWPAEAGGGTARVGGAELALALALAPAAIVAGFPVPAFAGWDSLGTGEADGGVLTAPACDSPSGTSACWPAGEAPAPGSPGAVEVDGAAVGRAGGVSASVACAPEDALPAIPPAMSLLSSPTPSWRPVRPALDSLDSLERSAEAPDATADACGVVPGIAGGPATAASPAVDPESASPGRLPASTQAPPVVAVVLGDDALAATDRDAAEPVSTTTVLRAAGGISPAGWAGVSLDDRPSPRVSLRPRPVPPGIRVG
ncbi:MAG TPA: hypothetical protein VK781_14550 [Solirubrobacteraceae bacterium]|jgi:hypothetical protein|nr:hypothetical protein [Solirubrobacteraceae bacterium]